MKHLTKFPKKFSDSYKNKTPPWGPLGYITYKRTYARFDEDLGRTEEWHETLYRCCQGILDIGGIFTLDEMQQLFDVMFNLKCCISGRALWQLGTKTVTRIGADSLQNCWHVAINEPYAFCFTFNQLMLGGGVGFNITPEQVYELPVVKYGVTVTRIASNDVDFIVPDNREGWIDLLAKVLNCFFYTGKNLTYSTNCVRNSGAKISSFGGIASGAETLVTGIEQIVGVLQSRVNHKLRPIDCLDILNIIGSIVVSGNVRRAAELAAGSATDITYLNAKNWNKFSVPNWRNMSNNSVICNDIDELPTEFWDSYSNKGEPLGLINLELCKSYGRLADIKDYRPDYNITGTNPCGEITLEPYEACNLGEIFLPNITSMEEFLICSSLMYKVCKVVSNYPFSDERVNKVVSKNHRLGISCAGILQSTWVQEPEKFSVIYSAMEELDIQYSRELGISTSLKLTTVQPGGTKPLLPGVTPGINSAYAPYYIRRIRFSSTDPLIKLCRDKGYAVEPLLNLDGSRNLDTMIVSFPIKNPSNAICAKDLTVIDQLKFQELMQTYWSDNAVSITCYYKQEELSELKQYLKDNYTDSIKSVSFLLHSEHGFKQAPYEEIDITKYKELSHGTEPIYQFDEDRKHSFEESLECEGGTCPIGVE